MKAHHLDCDCIKCHGSPPKLNEVEQLIQNVEIIEAFGNIHTGEKNFLPPQVKALINHVKSTATAHKAPRRGDVTREDLIAYRDAYAANNKGKSHGWIKAAMRSFNLSRNAIADRMK